MRETHEKLALGSIGASRCQYPLFLPDQSQGLCCLLKNLLLRARGSTSGQFWLAVPTGPIKKFSALEA